MKGKFERTKPSFETPSIGALVIAEDARNEVTYTVEWEWREEPGRNVCTGLSQRDLVRRLIGACKNAENGVIVYSVRRER